MVYPATPLEVEVGLNLGGTWVNATTAGGGVLHSDAIRLALGRSNWASEVDPARLGFTLRNNDGRWSPDLVTGAHYGLYHRNIPTRMGVGLGDPYLAPTGTGADLASTPNVAAIDLTGDLDLRADVQLHSDMVDLDAGGSYVRLAHKSNGTDGWEWALYNYLGRLYITFLWIDAGGSVHQQTSQGFATGLPLTLQHDRLAIRVTLDVDNGAAGHTVTFWTAPTITGAFTSFAAAIIPGTTSVKASTAPLRVGGNPADSLHIPLPGRFNAFELRSSIGGTVVANPTFTTQAVGATSFTDGAGRAWTIGTGGRITNQRWRFHGELASLPVRWDLAGKDITAPVEATGLFRRLRQGDRILESALRRATVRSATGLVQYWPCEDEGIALTQFGAAAGTAPLLVYAGGSPRTATNSDFPSSSPLPSIAGTAWAAWVDSYPVTAQWQVRWLMSVADGTTSADTPIFRIETTSGMVWELHYRDTGGGDLKLDVIKAGVVAYTTGWVAFEMTGRPMRMHLEVTTSGANVSYSLEGQPIGVASAGISAADITSGAPGAVSLIIVNQDASDLDIAIGHVTLQDTVTATSELTDGLTGYTGEPAGQRIQRLCLEEGIAFRIQGDPADTEPMGVQRPLTLPDLLQECAAADGGHLAEARDSVAIAYRTRVSMQSQAGLVLSYSAGEVAGTPELDRDDQGFANDITVATVAGGIGRAVLDDPDSPMSILEPPSGAGRYNVRYEANCLEGRAGDLAGWRLRLSAVDEPRVSRLSLETNLPAVAGSSTLTQSILDLGLGDLVKVTNLPANVMTGSIRQIVQGFRETITMFGHRIDMLTSPGSPWDARQADVDARYDTAGSILAAAAAQGATSISVSTLAGPAWTTAGADLPFDITVGGVRVTVSAIGAVSGGLQTFTITALPIARDVGFPIMLADPTYYEL